MNHKGENVWEIAAKNPYGVEPAEIGNVLICDITENYVIEVTPDKKVIWTFKGERPCDAFRLSNGNTLITEYGRFVEVTLDQKVVWEKKGSKYGTARRLGGLLSGQVARSETGHSARGGIT